MVLQDYDFEIKYLPGVENKVADALSRLVVSGEQGSSDDCEQEDEDMVCYIEGDSITHQRWFEALNTDIVWLEVLERVKTGWKTKPKGENELEKFWHVRDELSEHNGLLVRGLRLVTLCTLREELVTLAHAGHQGMSKAKERIILSYWWPGMDLQVERIIRDCVQCTLSKRVSKSKVQPMIIRDRPDGPWKGVRPDIVGPVRSLGSKWYVLVDLFSRCQR